MTVLAREAYQLLPKKLLLSSRSPERLRDIFWKLCCGMPSLLVSQQVLALQQIWAAALQVLAEHQPFQHFLGACWAGEGRCWLSGSCMTALCHAIFPLALAHQLHQAGTVYMGSSRPPAPEC